jgi:hypothetical protein
MFVSALLLNLTIPVGHTRLAGEYAGPMKFYDLFQKKDKEFEIFVRILPSADGTSSTWTTKYRYNPPEYQLEFNIQSASEDGNKWTEQSLNEKQQYTLSGWDDFNAGKTNWFQIEAAKIADKEIVQFRRRWTLNSEMLISEKWLKFKGKDWEFSHKMELKKIN